MNAFSLRLISPILQLQAQHNFRNLSLGEKAFHFHGGNLEILSSSEDKSGF